MDIQYLLWLQDFRNNTNNALTPFMSGISIFAVTYLSLIAVFYYWNIDKRKGLYTMVGYHFCMLFTSLIKLTACVYRPWIRSSRIVPAGDSIKTATGYSFPSGHTTIASSISGGMAVVLWGNKKTKWLSVIFMIFIPLLMFSRNYLGVHTPQDVLVGCIIAVLCLILSAKLLAYLDEHPEKENMLLACGFVFCCLGILYITVKPYPLDYNMAGELIVDPQAMMNDGYGDIGKMIGFLIARFVEKNWIKFEPIKNRMIGSIICVICLIPMFLLHRKFQPFMIDAFGAHWGRLFFFVIYTFYFIAFVPLLLKLINRKCFFQRA